MMTRSLQFVAASALLAAFGLAPRAEAAVGDAETVTCMYPVWVGFGPVHLANELGYFEEEGIIVEEILDDDMPNGIAAMERGDIDCYLRTVGEYQVSVAARKAKASSSGRSTFRRAATDGPRTARSNRSATSRPRRLLLSRTCLHD